jgi:hypothetical protein
VQRVCKTRHFHGFDGTPSCFKAQPAAPSHLLFFCNSLSITVSMRSFKGQHSYMSILSLLSLIILSFYLAKDGSPKIGERSSFSLLNTRESASNSSFSTNAGPPKGYARRVEDDPYTCGKDRPCSNGACCGSSGNCGYAPAYCGEGCISNCNATAECGQYAATPGKTCPLNACCSEHGFCGTTEVCALILLTPEHIFMWLTIFFPAILQAWLSVQLHPESPAARRVS